MRPPRALSVSTGSLAMGTSLSLLICSVALRNSLLCFARDVAMPSQYQYTYALHSVHEWMSRLGTIQQPACQELRPPRAHRFRPALWLWAHLTLFAQEHCANCLCFAQRCCNAVAICLHVRWCARGGCHQGYYPPWAIWFRPAQWLWEKCTLAGNLKQVGLARMPPLTRRPRPV